MELITKTIVFRNNGILYDLDRYINKEPEKYALNMPPAALNPKNMATLLAACSFALYSTINAS